MSDPAPSPARRGKIARLPKAIRDALNARLLDGQTGGQILPWLNALPEVQASMAALWGGRPVDDGALSSWRLGGYRDWLAERRKVEQLQALSETASDIARAAGGHLSEASVAILGGQILEGLEAAAAVAALEDQEPDDGADGEAKAARRKSKLDELVDRVTNLRFAEIAAAKLRLEEKKVTHKEAALALAREKFETATVEQFLKWANAKEAQAILNSGESRPIQMTHLRQLFFGMTPPSNV